ncbi:hypothetical protein N7G274_000421 [Stereocaulon virgatum]|uniref:Uncharacterized protein n=1 Tax=Stereocaulon virgatum TaxID=373712 RepID=A0ABR4AS39_9LECA
MATENRMNGYNGAHHPYAQAEPFQPSQGLNASTAVASVGVLGDESSVPAATTSEHTGVSEGNKPPSKDEVGWYFVEQYYTTLSKNPETLHLFYNKRSQFVSGVEAEKVDVSVGQHAINDRIKELDFQDCKVRVTNVDSQESFKSIVVQVIGEISIKAAPHRKFVQTFILAEQPKGYFVLNDIFRYIVDEEEEEMENGHPSQEPAPTSAPEAEPETLTTSADPVQQQHDVEEVDKKLEEESLLNLASPDESPASASAVNGHTATEPTKVDHAEDAPAAAVKTSKETVETPEQAAESTAVEDIPERPRDPDPTPVASPPKPTQTAPFEPTAPAAPSKPAAPKTWANLVAANRIASPAVPNGASSTAATPPPSQPKTAASTTNQSVTPTISTSDESPAKVQQNGNSGWQMAGSDNNKKHGRQQSQSVSGQDKVMAYVKNVTEKVDASILRTMLEKYENGKLPYYDVNRQKNCAFVEFTDQAAYNAAVAANPHTIGGEQVYVEERRPRANAFGGNFAGRGGMRGGRGGSEGRPGSQGRGGFPKDGGRGGFVSRGRGGSTNARGRGQPQAA